ncbi:NAD(P)-dependent oxidoreductase [Chachezhania sediminis]|uniref:NAD(P)-dependent oxidoreductase n=1 Tax=Chachezhania sediminis TaxID=2599291 RepID=UPI0018EF03A7|nr:NAD(P)-dependent oxidoreductase [Chachezhania sediminis]
MTQERGGLVEKIGLVGVGLMGHGIAKNLVTKGWALNYVDHPGNQPTDDLDAAGAVKWNSAADMAAACDVVVLCVTGSPQVEDVLIGSGGVLAALKPGTVIVDCSTAIPASTQKLAAQVEAQGAHFVDAAMTRTPKEAEEGRLNLLVGGAPELVDRLRPMLGAFAENIFYAGATGTGHQLKLLHNIVSLGSVTLLTEVFACAQKGGVDMGALVDCLRKGGGSGVALERVAPYVLDDGALDQMRFTVSNAAKDVAYYSQMASDLDAEAAVAAGVKTVVDGQIEKGNGGAFMPELIKLLQG